MNLSRWNLVLFALLGFVALLVLVALPGARGDVASIDARTGLPIPTVWDALNRARRSGNARASGAHHNGRGPTERPWGYRRLPVKPPDNFAGARSTGGAAGR